jgi:bifunctional UDP-N-acetylglucosamine pyrophosphorylase/glucosamine-1-phosphate N-acetyltransferase
VLVAFADTPLIRPATFAQMRAELAKGAAVVALGFEAGDPTGYGRLIVEGGRLSAIREHKDASESERAIRLVNAGLMALDGRRALALLDAIGDANAQGEFYLTDAVAAAVAWGLTALTVVVGEEETMGINDRVQQAAAEAALQKRLREEAMRAGVTFLAPETVFLSPDTKFGRDVTVEPYVVFGPNVSVADGATIRSFSHLDGAEVGQGDIIGPFARLRPGARLAANVHIGNFVEIKASAIGEGAKINHLSYVGDASVGARTNIGAGTITCNYDGFGKYRTTIGSDAFIGSNSALVAPVTVGDGAYVGSGSVITDDVKPDSLALGRGRQYVKDGWARTFRDQKAAAKAG